MQIMMELQMIDDLDDDNDGILDTVEDSKM